MPSCPRATPNIAAQIPRCVSRDRTIPHTDQRRGFVLPGSFRQYHSAIEYELMLATCSALPGSAQLQGVPARWRTSQSCRHHACRKVGIEATCLELCHRPSRSTVLGWTRRFCWDSGAQQKTAGGLQRVEGTSSIPWAYLGSSVRTCTILQHPTAVTPRCLIRCRICCP